MASDPVQTKGLGKNKSTLRRTLKAPNEGVRKLSQK